MFYLTVKHLHMTLAALSVSFFVVRAWWSVRESPLGQRRWVRVAPHVLDTLLLTCGLILMVLLRAWPHQTPWLAAKLTALLLYIGFGTLAIKRARSPGQRALFTVLAVMVFAYMVAVAITKSPLPGA
ncbi:invasion gene expression up-regulator, SirB [Alcanivorax sp. 521-1]|uniref:Invasion gene expression up-regulator, SirB n=1 Tax=Alloalcanivorax profundimaris TaxID=2735259 RepID=A0ABS0AQQ0_9GAMM|nr:SirB2 family protein [Alloalcanivorax profundimaris]MBF5056462.1 invasion gene expression up-regulator, SirB [Alloalcanivorax profundimaris]